ncbi:MAG: GGDEF domain-containing protein [Novosphingobium sp.]|nr:GGDEF domain-containing protein [Novosphingobium sp.]
MAFHTIHGLACVITALALFGPEHLVRMAAAFAVAVMTTGLLLGLTLSHKAHAEQVERAGMVADARDARQQTEELFAMTDMLQSADGYDDAAAVLMATSMRLLPGYGGALYVFNNSRDRLDLALAWNGDEQFSAPESLLPSNCWALKRGKAHVNDRGAATLCCMHHLGSVATLELPMIAKGAVYGLLILATPAEGAAERLSGVRRIGQALGDSMSLALSNIALREKLRTQSLRDPLTGLYNRRYMEDALERFVSLGERSSTATSVIMIDLDNFKRLNDENGHAKGDAVLRDVAAQLVGALRPSDVIARYGGEELVVILPSCALDDARPKAEMLRARIEGLTEAHGVPISASFGIACVPDTSANAIDVIPMADNALYLAKQAGKNCIRVAERRSGAHEFQPRLAVG